MFRQNVDTVSSTIDRRIFGTNSSIDPFRNCARILPVGESKKILKLRNTPIFRLSNFFALFPYRQRDEHFCLSHKSLIFAMAFLIVCVVHSYLHVHNVYETELSNINILLYSSYALVNVVFAATCIITPFFGRKHATSMLQDFSKVDAVVSRSHPDFEFGENHHRQRVQTYFTLGIVLYFMITYFAASQEHIFPSFTYLEFYIMPVTWLIIFQLDYLLVHLHKRFVFVNLQLKNFLDQRVSPKNTIGTLDLGRLNDLNSIHFTLYTISSKINDHYGVLLLVMIPRVIFFSVLPLHYNTVSALVNDPKQNRDVNPWSHIFTLSYIVLLISPIFYVVNVASSTVKQAKEMYRFVHDLIDEDQEKQIEYELLLISVQLLHRDIEFSVKQFYSLKPSLTTTILELIVTYVIIILQFQDTLSSVSPTRLLLRPLQQTNLPLNLSSITPLPTV